MIREVPWVPCGPPRGFSFPISGSPISTGGRVFATAVVGADTASAKEPSRVMRRTNFLTLDDDALMASLFCETGFGRIVEASGNSTAILKEAERGKV